MGASEVCHIRTPPDRPTKAPPLALVHALWQPMNEIVQSPLPGTMPNDREPPLDPRHWPIVASMVAAQFLQLTKENVPPRLGFHIIVESAVIASKIDPRKLMPNQWEIEVSQGVLTVKAKRNAIGEAEILKSTHRPLSRSRKPAHRQQIKAFIFFLASTFFFAYRAITNNRGLVIGGITHLSTKSATVIWWILCGLTFLLLAAGLIGIWIGQTKKD
jgi:hypothetical protein